METLYQTIKSSLDLIGPVIEIAAIGAGLWIYWRSTKRQINEKTLEIMTLFDQKETDQLIVIFAELKNDSTITGSLSKIYTAVESCTKSGAGGCQEYDSLRDNEQIKEMFTFIDKLETIAVAANFNIINKKLLYEIAGPSILNVFYFLLPIIECERTCGDLSEGCYEQLQKLCNNLSKKHPEAIKDLKRRNKKVSGKEFVFKT